MVVRHRHSRSGAQSCFEPSCHSAHRCSLGGRPPPEETTWVFRVQHGSVSPCWIRASQYRRDRCPWLGFVRDELADVGQTVRGIVIALEEDRRLRRALAMVPAIDFYRYEVSFKLLKI